MVALLTPRQNRATAGRAEFKANAYVIGRITDPVDVERIAAQGELLKVGDAEWIPPAEYHITLAAFDLPDPESIRIQSLIPAALEAIPAILDGVDAFQTPEGYAVHLTGRRQGELLALQRDTVLRLQENGLMVSPHSQPDSFLPHVTLCYSQKAPAPYPFAPFPVLIKALELSFDKQPLKLAPMRSAAPLTFLNADTRMTVLDDVIGHIRGYIAIWGSPQHRDSYQTWFDRERPPEMALDFAPFPICIEHGQSGAVRKKIVGRIIKAWFDDTGIAFEAILDQSEPSFPVTVDKILKRKYFTSSATAPHTAEFDAEGRFVSWILTEVSLTENPAESLMPAVTLIRSAQGPHDEGGNSAGVTVGMDAHAIVHSVRRAEMTPEQIQAMFPDLVAQYGLETVSAILAAAAQGAGMPDAALSAPAAPLPVPAGVGMPAAAGQPAAPLNPIGTLPPASPTAPPLQAPRAMDEDEEISARAVLNQMFRVLQSNPGVWRNTTPAVPQHADPTVRAMAQQMATLVQTVQQMQLNMMSAPPATQPQPNHNGGNGQAVRHGANSQGNSGGQSPRITGMRNLRFAHLTSSDMAFAYNVMRTPHVMMANDFQRPSEEFIRHMTFTAAATLEKAEAQAVQGTERFSDVLAVRSVFPFQSFRANELMASDIAGQGLEWVSVYYSSDLWEVARHRRIFDQLLRRGMLQVNVPDGAESAVVMLEGSDPIFYTANQPNDVDSTRRPEITTGETYASTAQVSVTPGELRARILYTDILNEDSLINLASQLNRQLNEAAADTIEYLFFNGDVATGANVNINLIDGTPSTAPFKPSYLASDGVFKLPLVTNTAVSRDATTLAIDDWPLTMALLPAKLWQDPERVVFVSDPYTYLKAIQLPDVKSRDVNSAATVETGVLNRVFGADYLASGQIALANAAGKISATPGNNTKGRLSLLYPAYWAMVNKRRITIETDRDIDSGTNKIVASMRLAFRRRSNDAAALSYNITV